MNRKYIFWVGTGFVGVAFLSIWLRFPFGFSSSSRPLIWKVIITALVAGMWLCLYYPMLLKILRGK